MNFITKQVENTIFERFFAPFRNIESSDINERKSSITLDERSAILILMPKFYKEKCIIEFEINLYDKQGGANLN